MLFVSVFESDSSCACVLISEELSLRLDRIHAAALFHGAASRRTPGQALFHGAASRALSPPPSLSCSPLLRAPPWRPRAGTVSRRRLLTVPPLLLTAPPRRGYGNGSQ
jgi:hypothetical protein